MFCGEISQPLEVREMTCLGLNIAVDPPQRMHVLEPSAYVLVRGHCWKCVEQSKVDGEVEIGEPPAGSTSFGRQT